MDGWSYLRNIDLIWQVLELWVIIVEIQHSANYVFYTLPKREKEILSIFKFSKVRVALFTKLA